MTDCARDAGFPVDHRLRTEILAVAARGESARETFAASDQATRGIFVELPQKAAEAGEIDGSLDLDIASVWLFALADGLIARTAEDPGFNFKKRAKERVES